MLSEANTQDPLSSAIIISQIPTSPPFVAKFVITPPDLPHKKTQDPDEHKDEVRSEKENRTMSKVKNQNKKDAEEKLDIIPLLLDQYGHQIAPQSGGGKPSTDQQKKSSSLNDSKEHYKFPIVMAESLEPPQLIVKCIGLEPDKR